MTEESNGTLSIIIGEPVSASPAPPVKLRHKNYPAPTIGDITLHRISTLSSGPSRARVGVSHLSVPLAWNSDEHFGTRGEGKVYSMFVVLQAASSVIDSRVVAAVDRTCTDVAFTDSFIFENQPVDFEIEIQLYASRTDGGDISQSLKQKLTRSLGRRLGAAYKSSWLSEDTVTFDSLVGGGGTGQDGTNNRYFHLLGRTKLTLSDAKPKTGIYDLHLSPNAANYGPPLYGHVRCRIVAQPNSVAMPLSDGILTIKPVGEDCLYQNMRCRLQGGVLRCTTRNSTNSAEQTLHIYINKESKLLTCKNQRSVIVTSDRYLAGTKRDKQYILISDSEEDIAAWRHAIYLQIADCEQWGEFAVSSMKLTIEPDKPDVLTLSRTNGRRLYDEIQIQVNGNMPGILKNDTCSPHRNLMDPSKMVSFAPTTKQNRTAPSGRRRNGRVHVRSLFQPANDNEHRYVINLPIGDVHTAQQTNDFSSKPASANGFCSDPNDLSNYVQTNGTQYQDTREKHTTRVSVCDTVPENSQENFFKGFKKSFQRSFGALKNRRPPVEVSRF